MNAQFLQQKVAKIRIEWLAMDIQRSGTDGAKLWMMVQDLLAIMRSMEDIAQYTIACQKDTDTE
jgi:hypothetical protein